MRSKKLPMLVILTGLSFFTISCAGTKPMVKVKLPAKPMMTELTNKELSETPMSVHQKFLEYGFEWEAWAEKCENLPCVQK